MNRIVWCVTVCLYIENVYGYKYSNVTYDPATRQFLDFKLEHPHPIGVITTGQGNPADIRDTVTLNTDIFSNEYLISVQSQTVAERIPERVVHAKGAGAYGYFEVTNDVSEYTKADVFNRIGKITPLVARFSMAIQNPGGSDFGRETRGLAIKFYTKEGNLDLVGQHIPVYFYRDPIVFPTFLHTFRRNPQTNLYTPTSQFEVFTLQPEFTHAFLWVLSDFGVTSYRRMDSFPIHTFEVTNKHGKSHFVRFNFRNEQGVQLIASDLARELGVDPDYAMRDLYNAIARKEYPSWRLEMDILSKDDLKFVDYNPFDVTRLWKNGTYHTVTVGRMVLNKNPDNFFKDVEMTAFNPSNLVPGIYAPPDLMYKARRTAYRDTQVHRLGVNHDKIEVNCPRYAKYYFRDGVPPVRDNMLNAPNYYQNSFNGPVPYVDEARVKRRSVLYDRNAVDLQVSTDFYNNFVTTEGHRRRMAANTAAILIDATPPVLERALDLLTKVDKDLGARVSQALEEARRTREAQRPEVVEITSIKNPNQEVLQLKESYDRNGY